MIKSIRFSLLAVCVAAFLVPTLYATTYFVPSDAELIQKSDEIVIATGVTSVVERTARGGVVTKYTLQVDESLKGTAEPGDVLTLEELGGQLPDFGLVVAGSPVYSAGEQYLIFSVSTASGRRATFGMEVGQFHLRPSGTQRFAVRSALHGFDGNLEPFNDRLRDAAAFIAYIRNIVAGRFAEGSYFRDGDVESVRGEVGSLAFTRVSYLLGGAPRWQTPSADWVISKTDSRFDENASVSGAIAEWNGAGAGIDYSLSGQDDTALGGLSTFDSKNAVLMMDPGDEVGSAAGIGGVWTSGNHTVGVENFSSVIGADVVINNTLSLPAQNCMNSVITHELGHTLGFRHSDTPPSGGDTTSNAIMNSVVQCSWNGVLKTYDTDAAQTVYGGGPVCTPVSITTEPVDRNVAVGTPTSLSVVAAGSTPISYQWYFGSASNTSNPVGGATSSSLSITPNSAGSGTYWVRVTNCSGANTDDSRTATVTATCTNPAISGISSNVTISEGQSTQLQVSTTGSATTFQWYIGTPTDRSQPTGSNSSVLTVSPSTTRSYWVEVSGPCGSAVQSSAVTVTVVPCADLTVDAPVATPGNAPGKYTLFVGATSSSGPITFAWFKGGTPGFGGTPAGQSQTLSVTVTAVTNYWARVQNGCGRVEFSSLITLAPCTLPTITTQPIDKTVNSNQSATLTIAVSAGATVKWFRGAVGDTTTQIGTGTSVNTPPLTVNTQFWAQVTNSCGSISSRQVMVTVQQLAELITMLNSRFYVQVRYINQFENPPRTGKLLGRSLYSSSTSETAVFTFSDPLVVELMVRLSDARPFDNKIHLYFGGLSDVEFYIIVTDSLTGIIKEYHKEANKLLGEIDRISFPATASLKDGLDALRNSSTLFPSPNAEVSTIRLLNNRFEVRMRFRNQFSNPVGVGYMNVRSIASSSTTETAVFFFDENSGSVEWMVRFSDARPFAQRIDFFHGGLSDVEYTIEVTDTVKGIFREYTKPPFSLAGRVDRDSFTP